ncbi:MAG: helix-turn-helix domain-containing protein, partial [Gemmatimonadota bacterium]
ARARELLGRACLELGDDEAGALELDAARAAYEELGARPDVARVEGLERSGSGRAGRVGAGSGPARDDHGLTPRQLEVLAELATGKTNRAIAGTLFISEKTVARHVSDIFAKLGVSSRAAATAYAYEHGLAGSPE